MNSLYALFKYFLLALGLTVCSLGVAQTTDNRGQIGLIYGLSVPDAENTLTHSIYGVNAVIMVSETMALGGYHHVSDSQEGPNSGSFNYNLTGLEGRYYISVGKKQVFLGLRAGVAKLLNTVSGTTSVYSPYHWGLVVGYSSNLWKSVGLGIEGSYLDFGSSITTTNSVGSSFGAFHMINFLAVMKFYL